MNFKRMLLAGLLVLGTGCGALAQALPPPVLKYDSQQPQGPLIKVDLTVVNWQAYAPVLFAPAPQLPPCGNNANSSRTWVDIFNAVNAKRIYGFCALGAPADLQNIWFATAPAAKPKRVYITLTDRLKKKKVRSNIIPIP